MIRSRGRSNGSRKVRSRLKTRAMNTPSGLVTAKTSRKKKRICNHPLVVISEFLRAQERVHEIDEQKRRNRQAQYGLQVHATPRRLEPVAPAHIGEREQEKNDRESEKDQV